VNSALRGNVWSIFCGMRGVPGRREGERVPRAERGRRGGGGGEKKQGLASQARQRNKAQVSARCARCPQLTPWALRGQQHAGP
jgi:hypothetical protein